MKRNTHLLIIDPQNDFCDLPADFCPVVNGRSCTPALPVPGAHDDMLRLSELILRGGAGLQQISITLDSHQRVDIAHPTFWHAADGSAPAPFTSISAAMVRAGQFLPRRMQALPRVLAYLDALEANGRYQLMIWPVHCEIGSWGHNVHDALRAAYNRWEETQTAVVAKVSKGENPWTEHYSALMAEVPDSADAHTQLNQSLLTQLAQSERIYIGGEAGSHCVKASTEHIVQHLPAGMASRIVLLRDAISPVTGFDAQYQAFLAAMQQQGVQLAACDEVLPELLANI